MTFINGDQPVFATQLGIHALSDKYERNEFTITGQITDYIDWGFNEFIDDTESSRMFVTATDGVDGSITLYSLSSHNSIDNHIRREELWSGGIDHAKVLLNQMLYTNVGHGNRKETRVWGISAQEDIEDYLEFSILLNGGGSGLLFDEIVPCCIDHALFINSMGIFIDGYSENSYDKKLEDGDDYFMFPSSGSLIQVIGFADVNTKDGFKNIDTTYSSDNSKMMIGVNLENEIRFIPVKLGENKKVDNGRYYILNPLPLKDSDIEGTGIVDIVVLSGSTP